jgi:hypothetical protein
MHIYLDESGNPAPLSRPAATRYFALAAIVIPDREEVAHAISSAGRNKAGIVLGARSDQVRHRGAWRFFAPRSHPKVFIPQRVGIVKSTRLTTKPPASTVQVAFFIAKQAEIWYSMLVSVQGVNQKPGFLALVIPNALDLRQVL